MPNQYLPDLCAPPKSLSAHLKFGCLSVRRFYWSIQDTYLEVSVPVFVYSRDRGVCIVSDLKREAILCRPIVSLSR